MAQTPVRTEHLAAAADKELRECMPWLADFLSEEAEREEIRECMPWLADYFTDTKQATRATERSLVPSVTQ